MLCREQNLEPALQHFCETLDALSVVNGTFLLLEPQQKVGILEDLQQ